MSIVGTQNGRIFMAGKDGCLYELAYQVTLKVYFNIRIHNLAKLLAYSYM